MFAESHDLSFVKIFDEKTKDFDSKSGLPDGIFSNQKFQFWYTFEGLGMEYFMTIWYFGVIWCI
jgi:hypothetical protein